METVIYRKALELVEVGHAVIGRLPTGCGFLADQLRRSTSSVVLNFAEGYVKPSAAEQRRFFTIALGSAQESLAIFDVARALGAIRPEAHTRGTDLADHLCRMLWKFRRR
ncbi:MAG: four helix bundle protein [Myxococcota bacterium]